MLSHPHVKAFVSHGGYNSLLESLEQAVPLIINPLKPIDQPINCEMVQENGYGVCMPLFTYQKLKEKIDYLERNNYL